MATDYLECTKCKSVVVLKDYKDNNPTCERCGSRMQKMVIRQITLDLEDKPKQSPRLLRVYKGGKS